MSRNSLNTPANVANAIIREANIEIHEFGFLTTSLVVEYGDGTHQNFGGSILALPGDHPHFRPHTVAGHYIRRVMKTVGVKRWQDLVGRPVRVVTNGCSTIIAIGNIVKDEWFNPGVEMEELKK